jgi:hypothetical protein
MKNPKINTPEWFAKRYCDPQHDSTKDTAQKRLGLLDIPCSVCGKPLVPFRA